MRNENYENFNVNTWKGGERERIRKIGDGLWVFIAKTEREIVCGIFGYEERERERVKNFLW